MRTYLILKEKVARFNADAEIQGLLRELRERGAGAPHIGPFTAAHAQALKAQTFDLPALRAQGYSYEKLDQLTMEILLGVR
jgi:xylose isomerase